MVISGGKTEWTRRNICFRVTSSPMNSHKKPHPGSNSGSAVRNFLVRRKVCLPRSSRFASQSTRYRKWSGYEPDDQGISVPLRLEKPHFIVSIETRSVTHPGFYLMGTGDCFDVLQAAGSSNWLFRAGIEARLVVWFTINTGTSLPLPSWNVLRGRAGRAVGMAARLRAGRSAVRIRVRGGFLISKQVETSPEAHSAPTLIRTWAPCRR